MAVTLSAFDNVFLKASWNWLQDEELRKLVDAPVITKEQQQSWFETLPQRRDYYIWGVLYDGKPVGVTGIKNIKNNTGEYWGYIGDKNYWGKGIGSAMMQCTIAEAYSLQLKQLTLKVLRTNQRAIQLYEKNGFVQTQADETHLLMQKTLS
ncbi:MAG: GNAT family N-acetyltransferase [Lacibacter sp.]|jgi:RimJ/RimL family protein N-acetyltransferase